MQGYLYIVTKSQCRYVSLNNGNVDLLTSNKSFHFFIGSSCNRKPEILPEDVVTEVIVPEDIVPEDIVPTTMRWPI